MPKLNSKTAILSILVGATLCYLLFFSGNSDEEQLLSILENARKSASIEATAGPFEAAARIKQSKNVFCEQLVFDLSEAGYKDFSINSRQQLKDKLLQLQAALRSLELTLSNVEIELGQNATATATFELAVLGKLRESNEEESGQFFDLHRIQVEFQKLKSKNSKRAWCISSAKHLENLRE